MGGGHNIDQSNESNRTENVPKGKTSRTGIAGGYITDEYTRFSIITISQRLSKRYAVDYQHGFSMSLPELSRNVHRSIGGQNDTI